MWDEQELTKMTSNEVAPFPMLADAGGNLGRVYGVYNQELGINVRGSFLIDPEGIVQSCEILSPAVGRNLDEMLRQVQAYKLVRENEGTQATPMGWVPGKDVLTPNEELVGNVWKVWSPKK